MRRDLTGGDGTLRTARTSARPPPWEWRRSSPCVSHASALMTGCTLGLLARAAEGVSRATGTVRHVDWATLGASIGSCVLFALLCSAPFLVGAPYGVWLVAPAVGVVAGTYLYLRRDRYSEPGPDADETRFPR